MGDDLAARASAPDLAGRVHFLGAVDRPEQVYRAADIACVPSRNEGLPLAPLEAQACGTPVVVSDVGACREAVCPATGSLFPAGDVAAMAEALQRGLATPRDRSPRQFVAANADARGMAQRYQALYAGARP